MIDKKRIWLFKISTVLFTLAALVVVFETYFAIHWQREHAALVNSYDKWDFVTTRSRDPRLIYTYQPNKHGTNSRGYFDYEYPYSKGKDVFRIVVIGDSIAQGVIDDGGDILLKDTAFKILEEKLNQPKQKPKYEVIVLARSGYSTSQELIVLEDEAFRYDPDVILWSYVLNYPAHPLYHNANGDLGRYFFRPKSHCLQFILKTLFIARESIKGKDSPSRDFYEYLHWVYWDQVKQHLNKIGALARARNIPTFFFIHPVLESPDNLATYPYGDLHEKLNAAALQAGLTPLDLSDAFKGRNIVELRQDSIHPNAEGQRLLGDFLYEKFQSLGAVAP